MENNLSLEEIEKKMLQVYIKDWGHLPSFIKLDKYGFTLTPEELKQYEEIVKRKE